jgi:transcriptional repressor NrdR
VKCPFCGAVDDRVVDSRESREGEVIRRRRECDSCGRRFTSYETIEEIPYMVVKKDGRREHFDRKKLRAGLVKACEKRPVASAQLDTIVDEVEMQLHDTEEREMSTSDIGFASVYRKFEDVDEFLRELKNLLGRADAKATP